jgi:hypothetical protein
MVLDIVSFQTMIDAVLTKQAVQFVRIDNPWAMVSNGSDTEALRITACFANLGAQTFIAGMCSSWDSSEPLGQRAQS